MWSVALLTLSHVKTTEGVYCVTRWLRLNYLTTSLLNTNFLIQCSLWRSETPLDVSEERKTKK